MELTGKMLQEACNRSRAMVARMLGKQAGEAEDVLQDACVKAIKYIDRFEGNSEFYTWFYSIARNAARERLSHRGQKVLSRIDGGVEADSYSSGTPNPEELVLLRERNDILVDCLLQLSSKKRSEILVWATTSRLVADTSTRKVRRLKAKRELREMLEAR